MKFFLNKEYKIFPQANINNVYLIIPFLLALISPPLKHILYTKQFRF